MVNGAKICLALLFVMFAAKVQAADDAELKTHEQAASHIRVKAAASWTEMPASPTKPALALALNFDPVQGSPQAVLAFTASADTTAIPKPKTWADVTMNGMRKSIPDVAVVESKAVKVAGEDGWAVVFTGTSNGQMQKFRLILLGHSSHAYTVVFMSTSDKYDEQVVEAQKVVDSLEWTDKR